MNDFCHFSTLLELFFTSYCFWDIEDLIFVCFNSAPYSVLQICHSIKVFCSKNTVDIKVLRELRSNFYCRKRRHRACLLRLFEMSRNKTNSVVGLQIWTKMTYTYVTILAFVRVFPLCIYLFFKIDEYDFIRDFPAKNQLIYWFCSLPDLMCWQSAFHQYSLMVRHGFKTFFNAVADLKHYPNFFKYLYFNLSL